MTWAIFVTSWQLGYLLDKARKGWAEKGACRPDGEVYGLSCISDALGFKASISHSQHGAK